MIPVKGKKYMLNCQGPFEWNRYMGEGICTGETEDYCDKNGETFIYGFKIPLNNETCFFEEESIVAEFSDDNQVRPSICDPKNYPEDDESPYCEKCSSCGETGCCPPINCEAVKCKYGEINLKDYQCFQDQWEVMHNALTELWEFDQNIIARNALNAVDKLWDKLYSKE